MAAAVRAALLTCAPLLPPVFLASPSTLHLVFNLPLAKLYINSLLSTLNARAFTSNARYTMHSSALRNVHVNQLKQAESGAIRSQGSGKGFNPISSNSEVTAVVAGDAKTGAKKGFLQGLAGTAAAEKQRRQEGIHIVTVEERFESTLPNEGPQPLPYLSSGRGPRTPGESRKSSEEDFGITQESLAMTAMQGKDDEPVSPSTPPMAAAPNHPYQRY